MILDAGVLGLYYRDGVCREDVDVFRIIGGDRDEGILDPQDRATKALSWSTRVAVANSFARKSSTRLVIGKACTVI